ncbi:MAG: hypothetical protein A3F31_04160 [Candidatus Levybacteria bacterium RIFCSPHIGHO2_12_FULL_38_12]|nr:MAG: hypothetical protein A3F31_04160 [Candidatus Levybacteria bacterium RIFCSPHIGHO2_12_FULL_38_12]OGH34391.1 MAG: hypothetical protein A3A47_04555 [Candidatus Levybacteria bacterium RIFCSPLOWO2_01_FULL_37_20]OGH44424.1 MAG: hypothetical protein A3J14_03155 [Candidatus Levybacteria bacterium RIFCSPLOWO2_02_FULL_37_18]OGH51462.1 MAG: hypothetical protein A3G13_01715 [Candidatus Levybacteria bacterium RIFCSPLOWO2_12_FULL_37_7]
MPEIINKICSFVIEYSFYLLFFLVPLVFTSNTSELFEFNKMWVTFGITTIIVAAWTVQMIVSKRFFIQKTPLDIPILLFLASQFFATLFSWDRHVSIWGYYSRFNGGFLSTLSYITLYYAFVTFLPRNKKIEHKGTPFILRISLFIGAVLLIIAGTYLSTAFPNHQAEENAVLFFIFILISFFLFIFSQSGGFLKRLLIINLVSGLVVALWGLPSHFGFDPTCLLFRGTFDVSCWNEAFQPKIRIFSTLGQPNWLAAYLSVLIPIALAFGLKTINLNTKARNTKQNQNSNNQNSKRLEHSNFGTSNLFRISNFGFLILTVLFYIDVIFTDARSGFIGLLAGLAVFSAGIVFVLRGELKKYVFSFITIALIFLIATFFFGSPIMSIRKFTYPVLKLNWEKKDSGPRQTRLTQPEKPQGPALETGGTESGSIRLNVWRGALDAWKDNPLFGTGVETFAFAYYKYRPQAHNLTSEWDYLYNKAHNEYLNYLATTGLLGLGTYVGMIGMFLWIVFKTLIENRHPEFISGSSPNEIPKKVRNDTVLALALLSGYISILVSNFFGFSVVIINLYLFLIPAIVFGLLNIFYEKENEQNNVLRSKYHVSSIQWVGIALILLTAYYILNTLYLFWLADTAYALGSNLNKTGSYDRAYIRLRQAVATRPSEPTFKDELSINEAILAIKFAKEKEVKTATQLVQDSMELSNQLNTDYPNNIVFLKTRVRVFSQLAQVNEQYLQIALDALIKAKELAPTDAKIAYNLGVIFGELGNKDNTIYELKRATELRPNYLDSYYALGLFYHQLSLDKNGKIENQQYFDKGVKQMRYIISHFSNSDSAKTALKTWDVEL